jgi:predicted DNA-binding transcriptional regulator YafY
VRADRLITLVLLLQARGRMTAPDLAARLEVSARTIYRDLDALSAAGVPVYADRGTGGGISLPDGYRLDLTALNRDEASALFLSSVPQPLGDLGAGQVLEAALRKLSAALPPAARIEADRVRQRLHLDPAEWWQTHEPVPHLRAIQEAVWQDRRLRLSYRRRDGNAASRLVDPYGLVAKASVWYLVAALATGDTKDHPADDTDPLGGTNGAAASAPVGPADPPLDPSPEVRVFRVSRVEAAEPTGERARRPADFDLPGFWAAWSAAFERDRPRYPVLLRVAPAFVPLLPQIFGEGMRATITAEGRTEGDGALTLPLTFENAEVACARVLGLGPDVEVLVPAELRERVARRASAVAGVYRPVAAAPAPVHRRLPQEAAHR